jgi:ribosomal protein S18 acetylase RimI-like enzyme
MTAATIPVRSARESDQAALIDLDATAWSPESGFPSVIRAAGQSGVTFFTAADPPGVHLVAELDDVVVGYVRLKPPTHLPENAHVTYVSGLAVRPSSRRRGVAAALMTAAEPFARTRGARKLSLRVLSTNQPAIRLYGRLGFDREGTLRDEFLIGGRYVDDVLMAKRL